MCLSLSLTFDVVNNLSQMDREKRRSSVEEAELDKKIAMIREKNVKIVEKAKVSIHFFPIQIVYSIAALSKSV